jgi:addiction module RelE/StbE family toxin
MRKIVLTSRFKKSLRKYIKGNKHLEKQVEETLKQMVIDLSAITLATHKLKGDLEGFRACSCGYDCRIVFVIEKDITTNEELLVLLNIGSHDQVY